MFSDMKWVIVLCVGFTALLQSHQVPGASLFDVTDHDTEVTDDIGASQCTDDTDCDPYGFAVCNRSTEDWRWSRACCRLYCGFCNLPIPRNVSCDEPPPY